MKRDKMHLLDPMCTHALEVCNSNCTLKYGVIMIIRF